MSTNNGSSSPSTVCQADRPVVGIPKYLQQMAQGAAAEFRGNVARQDYEGWALRVLPVLDFVTFFDILGSRDPSIGAINAALPLLPQYICGEGFSIETSEAEARDAPSEPTDDDVRKFIKSMRDDAAALRLGRSIENRERAELIERAAAVVEGMLPKRTADHDVADTGPSPMYSDKPPAVPLSAWLLGPVVNPPEVLQALSWALGHIEPMRRDGRFEWAVDVLQRARLEWNVEDVTPPWERPAKAPQEGVSDPLDPRNAPAAMADMTGQFVRDLVGLLQLSRDGWPSNSQGVLALVARAGDAAEELMRMESGGGNPRQVWDACVTVAIHALRLAVEGDEAIKSYRPVCGAPVAPKVVKGGAA